MAKKIFIDGSAGTTGLRIFERLSDYGGIELIKLSNEKRKDEKSRKDALNSADVAFLCLPDEAAREAVGFIENDKTVVIDTSTAHRTESGWAYGFPELSGEHLEKIKGSKHIAVPGCHASGCVSLVFPLVESGVLKSDALLSCFSLTGYSGGGKKMIAEYESPEKDALLSAPRQYGLPQQHKHLKEMRAVTGLVNAPAFCPVVAPFYSGMEVTVPVFKSQLESGVCIDDIKRIFSEKYNSSIVTFNHDSDENGFISAGAFSGKDSMEISVFGNEDRILLVSRFDNLGKGASGAAVECLNIVLGNKAENALEL